MDDGTPAGDGSGDAPGGGDHRVRRRRRAASRAAGPPTPSDLPTADPGAAAPPDAPAPDAPATDAAATGAPTAPAGGTDPLADDPVAREDRRRERRRRSRATGRDTSPPAGGEGEPARRADGTPQRDRSDRAARALEGSRSTQVPWTDAVRAREWAAPTAEDLAAAAEEVVLVRRHYVPPEPLPVRQDRRPRRGQR